jgi:ABC-2 type transport system ATP-binding protein
MSAITAKGLTKKYRDTSVLDGLDLTVDEGSVFALLGPNGAGKTTTVRILTTLIAPDGGTAAVAGHDLARHPHGVRASIGVTGQFSAVDELLTARENLRLMGDLLHLGRATGRQRSEALLDRFDLGDDADRPVSTFSGGLRRRVDLAMTLMGEPKVIFLDEPTTGLDPRSRREVWAVVRELTARGTTIFLTTQYLEEADALADRVALLDHGRLIAEGTPATLKQKISGGHLSVVFTSRTALDDAQRLFPGAEAQPESLTLKIPGDGGLAWTRVVLTRLTDNDVESFSLHTPDLDDVFLALTGKASA